MAPPTVCMFPAINLRMKCAANSLPVPSETVDGELCTDQLDVMAHQDSRQCSSLCGYNSTRSSSQALDMEVARKRMIDWKFRVVDHYGIARDSVATSTAILDRYMHVQVQGQQQWRDSSPRKSTYKLAAMTALYMAAKVQDQTRLLPLEKLVELSRGEFFASDIMTMENRILAQLSWKVHPVTVHSMIHSLIRFIVLQNAEYNDSNCTNSDPMIMAAIYDRAIFFAELSLFEKRFVTTSRAFLAVAAVLNALEGIGESLACERAFLEGLKAQTDLDMVQQGPSLDQIREDMWYIYSLSAQYQEDDRMNTHTGNARGCVSPSSAVSFDSSGSTDAEDHKALMHHQTYSPITTVR